jgi:hypothetical protein
MPAKDLYHEAVKNALIKDGWTITADPFPLNMKMLNCIQTWRSRNFFPKNKDNVKLSLKLKAFSALQ